MKLAIIGKKKSGKNIEEIKKLVWKDKSKMTAIQAKGRKQDWERKRALPNSSHLK
jgi:hypothetical protein